ncbi:DUF4350 domain-containing protein [Calycomorphotria hydatis]|uniref:DUF4350 domain-containing protein n=1 Tax=Calycomorphotria hydatis TaxID=2528027 RepID=A0A517T6A3_9PLAN|nr:DUF4350 domain-containing protein [Calycomorphotria hydatis]QDT63903.1 hypothetical protein V22_11300 [Calycomorphotria hydatis]
MGSRSQLFPLATTLLLACVLFAFGVQPSIAAEETATTLKVEQAGFDGAYKAGRWLPLTVSIHHAERDSLKLQTGVLDADGALMWRETPCSSLNFIGDAASVPVQAGRAGSDIHVRLVDEAGNVVAEQLVRAGRALLNTELFDRDFLIVTVNIERELKVSIENLGLSTIHVAQTTSANLPDVPQALTAVDCLVISPEEKLTEEQASAIQKFVEMGGHVVLSFSDAELFEQSSFQAWSPIQTAGTLQLRELGPLERYARAENRVRFRGRVRGAELQSETGDVLVEALDGPLLITENYGYGRVTVLGVQIGEAPLAGWSDLPLLLATLLSLDPKVSTTKLVNRNPPSSTSSTTELMTQLDLAYSAPKQVLTVSRGTLLIMLLILVAIIGPLDYLLVHRVLKKPHLTWITFPIWAVVVSFAAHAAAPANQSQSPTLREFEIVDLDMSSGVARGHAWMSLSSPTTARYSIEVKPIIIEQFAGDTQSFYTDWFGAPEDAFGGRYRSTGGGFLNPSYTMSTTASASTIQEWPILTAGLKKLESTWLADVSDDLLQADLKSTGIGRLNGELQHQLPGTITDWAIAYDDRLYSPRGDNAEKTAVKQGDVFKITPTTMERTELERYLNRIRKSSGVNRGGKIGEETQYTRTAYDPKNRDLDRIMETVTFHEAAGGPVYTGLANSALIEFDLSQHLTEGMAVLFGRYSQSTVEMTVHSGTTDEENSSVENESTTLIRVLLPVQSITQQRKNLPNFREQKSEKSDS